MNVPNLPVNILHCYAERPPKRQLSLECEVTNPAEFDICILDVWVTVVEKQNGLKLAEGKLFQSMHNRVSPAIIPQGKKGLGAFHIDLPSYVLQSIEERRAEGDVNLIFYSRVMVAKVVATDDIQVLAVPFETSFGNLDGRFEHLIPQSEWIKLLKSLEWSELELLELPTSRLHAIPSLARALSRFEDAQDCFRRGDWEETMLNCRKVFEAIVYVNSGKEDMGESLKVFTDIIGEPKKAETVSKLTKALGGFLHLGRHENQPPVLIKRADSQLALLLTGALLIYLGNQ